MKREAEMTNAQIAEKVGYLRRQLAVVGLALDALRAKEGSSFGLDGLEELVYDIGSNLEKVESQLDPEQPECTGAGQ